MDVTPRELRDMDIREGFRGYNRDDVDELLERAAATIEQLEEQVRRAQDRVSAAENDAGRGRENEEMLQRTLLLAQKTADEAINDAQSRAKQMVEEAETRAYALVSEAEATARRMAMAEQRRLEAEVLGLGARREALLADIDNLERFESEYRARLRRAIEADLESLDARPTVSAGPRPSLHEVELPSGDATHQDASRSEPSRAEPSFTASPSAPAAASVPPPPPASPAPPAAPAARPEHDTVAVDAVPPFPDPTPAPPPSIPSVAPAAEQPDAASRDQLFRNDEAVDAQVLDDDAFFASLREAVRDERPLGPVEHRDYDADDEDDSGRFGNVFKRRR